MTIDHVRIQVYGERNQLLGFVNVPGDALPGFDRALAQARLINPVYDHGLLARWIVRSGLRSVITALRMGKVEVTPGGM